MKILKDSLLGLTLNGEVFEKKKKKKIASLNKSEQRGTIKRKDGRK